MLWVEAARLIGGVIPLGNMLAYTILIGNNRRLAILSLDRGVSILWPESYRPYENYYGWSADGRLVIFSNADGNTEIFVWDWNTLHNISQNRANDWRPAISQDGHVAFASERDGNMEIYVWDGHGLINISQDLHADDLPVWSKDGQLAWISNRAGNADIMIWNTESVMNVSENSDTDFFPTWSMDGRLAWVSDRDDSTEVHIWDTGGATVILERGGPIGGPPCWTGDGLLLWSEQMSGVDAYQLVVWDGQSTTKLAEYTDSTEYACSPDHRLAFKKGRDMLVWDGQSFVDVLPDHTAVNSRPIWLRNGDLIFRSTYIVQGQSLNDLYLWDGQSTRYLVKGAQVFTPVSMP